RGGVRVRIRLAPGASANAIVSVEADGDGNGLIKARVTAVAEAGKANGALIKLLSRQWRLKKSSIQVIHGATDRNKTLLVAGETEVLLDHLHLWLRNFLAER
ncbi:MAG TPA: DUF167 domain-containing protein, partial [Rhodospirillales bacterium]|nr:DUF167 domain-containing protein [Rhodospirillales bacterium]